MKIKLKLFFYIIIFLICSNLAAQNSRKSDHECLGLLAVLPVMLVPEMDEYYRKLEASDSNQPLIPLLLSKINDMANKNNPDALYTLGVFYDLGYCVEQNKSVAIKFYKKASELGSARAKDALIHPMK